MRGAVAIGCMVVVFAVTAVRADDFDHGKQAGWELLGKHRSSACTDCHRDKNADGTPVYTGLAKGTDCRGCHTHEKVHDGRWTSAQCMSCHEPERLVEMKIDKVVMLYHGPNAEFPLVKQHRGVPCVECHKARDASGRTAFDKVERQCAPVCHDDAGGHGGTLGPDCNACHVSGTWTAAKFDHQKRSPLVGFHLQVTCLECHPKGAKDFATAPTACGSCHADVHGGTLGGACEKCHQPTGDVTFDHRKARFRVDGAHRAVACARCHTVKDFTRAKTECEDCHDDPHRGRKGHACEACHSTRTFAKLR